MNLLTRLRELSEKASKNWEVKKNKIGFTVFPPIKTVCFFDDEEECFVSEASVGEYSAELIALMRNNIDKLLDVVEAAKECTRFYAIPGETWEKLEDCVSALER